MKFIDLFPTSIFQDTIQNITDIDIISYKNFISKEHFLEDGYHMGKTSNNQQVLSNPLFKKLHDNILDSSRIYLREINHDFEDVQISCSWINLLNFNNYIRKHSHDNSYLSGVFYFDNSSPINFFHPLQNSYAFTPSPSQTQNTFRGSHYFTLTPTPKSIILFPSWLEHNVTPPQDNNRISIAFNVIPKGEFGPTTAKLYL